MRANARIISLRAAAGAALLASLLAVHPAAARQEPLTTAFTYQGELAAAGAPAAGTFDIRFRLYDSPSSGNQIGSTLCTNDLVVENGRFAASLDFGSVFTGQKRFLEIEVREDSGLDCSDLTGYTVLSPRQELTAAPNASFAQTAASAASATTAQSATTAVTASNATSLNGQSAGFYQNAANLTGTVADARLSSNIARLNANQTFTGIVNLSNPTNAISGVFSGSGAGLSSLNGASIAPGSLSRTVLRADVQSGLATVTGDWGVTPYSVTGTTALGGRNYGIIAADGRLYTLAVDQQQLQIWGLSNPLTPNLLGSAPLGGPSVGVAVRGSYAYVVNITTSRMQVFNISNPAAPVLVGSIATVLEPRLIMIAGANAYVMSYGSSTLQIFDLSSPESPPARGSVVTGTSPSNPVIIGTLAYWTNFFDGTLTVADVSNVQAPAIIRSVSVGPYAGSVVASGQHLYIGMATTPEVRIYDIGNPQLPVLVGTVGTGSQVGDVRVTGGYLHVLTASPKTVRVYDLGTPNAPTLVGSVALSSDSSDPAGMAIVGSNAYVATTSFSVPALNSLHVVSSGGRVSFSGPLASSALSGVDGSGLTNLNVNASSIGTGTLSNARTTGTALNTANALVMRDPSGNFSAGTITASLDGNASTATTASNASLLNGQPGSFYTNASNITAGTLATAQIPSLDASKITSGTLANAQTTGTDQAVPGTLVLRDASGNFEANRITAPNGFVGPLAGNATSASNTSQLNFQPASYYTNASNMAAGTLANARTTGSALNTPSTLVLRDASGNFAAGTISAALNGNATSATTAASATTAITATNATQLNGQLASFYTNASNLSAGTLPDARLSISIPRLNTNNSFTSTSNSFAGRVGVNTPAGALELDVNGRVNVAQGVIQKDLSAGVVTGTTDLGLYSQVAGGWIRFVTNGAQFAWFSDSGPGTNARMVLSSTGNLTVSGSLAKAGGSFKIDHPLDPKNKILYHSFVESPDMMNIYNGEVTTDDNGYAVITMPDYFEALNRDFRYQLTVIDDADQPDVVVWAKVVRRIGVDGSNRFSIRSSRGNTVVSWQVTGIRHDAWAEKNRIPNSVDKVGDEKGKYLHPDAFNEPAEAAAQQNPAAASH